MFEIAFFRSGKSKISALALLLMHWDHLQFGLYYKIKLLDWIWFLEKHRSVYLCWRLP